ncbi:hypothetical protein [Flammeovirga sp. OC4]|uniref:hypothetical protein n=1 Tax=Flammeovirga sp. OC4 TaxID=1382345 RepID=UPI0012E060DF|nr:hypothetical protein [Flammeovirga sp. OC4]
MSDIKTIIDVQFNELKSFTVTYSSFRPLFQFHFQKGCGWSIWIGKILIDYTHFPF